MLWRNLLVVMLGALPAALDVTDSPQDVLPAASSSGDDSWETSASPLDLSKVTVTKDGAYLDISVTLGQDRAGSNVDMRFSIQNLYGKSLSSARFREAASNPEGLMRVRIKSPKIKEAADAVEYVLHYRGTVGEAKVKGAVSLLNLVPQARLAVLAPSSAFTGSPIRIPVSVSNLSGFSPLTDAKVVLTVQKDNKTVATTQGITDGTGWTTLEFKPEADGQYSFRVAATHDKAFGATQQVNVTAKSSARLMLSLDKPLYQPGQTVHVRSLALSDPDRKPVASKPVLLEAFDSKGNKIFKQTTSTNEYGVVSGQILIGPQVNLGPWKVEATIGDVKAEKSFTVDRYSLPKYKVSVNIDKPLYKPGEEVSGTVNARYFFGKPASKATVRVTALDYQGTWVVHREIQGIANEEGIYRFSFRLPNQLIGQPLGNGNAVVMLDMEVADTAGQTQKESRQITVVANPVDVALVPESGSLVRGVRNRVFVLAADAVGNPASTKGTVEFITGDQQPVKQTFETGDSGLGQVEVVACQNCSYITANLSFEHDGATYTRTFNMGLTSAGAVVLLRPEKTLAAAGEALGFDILAPATVSNAFLDITREGQTILTTSVPMANGTGKYRFTPDASMAGTLVASAYVLSASGEYVRDSRVIYLDAKGDLVIKSSLDKETYKPGEKANIRFNVTDAAGNGAQAALGVHIVDEAVFALSESRPGLLKLFFLLEEELLSPQWQVGPLLGRTLGGLMEVSQDTPPQPDRQALAEAALASRGDVASKQTVAYSVVADASAIQAKLEPFRSDQEKKLTWLAMGYARCDYNYWDFYNVEKLQKRVTKKFQTDPWGNPLAIYVDSYGISITSSGPDAIMGTYDDVSWYTNVDIACEKVFARDPEKKKAAEGRGGWVRGVGMGGGAVMDDRAELMMLPAAAATGAADKGGVVKVQNRKDREQKRDEDKPTDTAVTSSAEPEVRVRQWFPETLFVENCLITDNQGNTSVEVPLADSITTWRMSTVASDSKGRLGGSESGIRVFQDFFVDIDFPAFLTRNDEVTFPVVVYNYLDRPQDVTLTLQAGDWFTFTGRTDTTLSLGPNEVKAIRYPVKIAKVGWHELTVFAKGSGGLADAVRRTVEVRSDGTEVVGSISGQFNPPDRKSETITIPVEFPPETIPDSERLAVVIMPGLTSHIVSGMESMLRLPGG